MKTLEQYDNIDKADLLFRLFPEQIPAIVEFIEGMCLTIMEDEQRIRKRWDNGLFTFNMWLSWVKEAQTKISKYGPKLHKNKRLFTDQLFDGLIACYSNYCIEVYVTTRQHSDKRFVHAVQMLYNF